MGEYPTEDELARITAWPPDDPLGWLAFVKAAWHWWPSEAWGWNEYDEVDHIDKSVRAFNVSTGGWSGNEEIIGSMQENTMLWLLTWHSSTRGGHHVFMVRR